MDDNKVGSHRSVGVRVTQGGQFLRQMIGRRTGMPLPGLMTRESAPVNRGRADSWFASNGSALSRLMSQAQVGNQGSQAAAGSRLILETIIGPDDRQQITDTSSVPYAWICDLSITDATGTIWLGTGWLASSRLVVTAGHCVYLRDQGGWAQNIRVAPSRNGSTSPYVFDGVELHSVDGWVSAGESECDYGAIILPRSADGLLGHFGFAAFPDSQISSQLVNVVGYPADKSEGTLWGSVNTLNTSMPNILLYENDTYGGMSGSPVILWNGTDYFVVGIHNYGDIRSNRATRITSTVFTNVQDWMSRALSV